MKEKPEIWWFSNGAASMLWKLRVFLIVHRDEAIAQTEKDVGYYKQIYKEMGLISTTKQGNTFSYSGRIIRQ